jgi:membrane protein insertase Oxa1/YidC/SpoIIIJ
LEEGGAFWFTNLAAPDPYYILPVASVLLTYANLQRGVTKENADFIINRIRGVV